MTALILHIARPVTLWALHFIAIYALISAACAPRALIDGDMLRLAAGGLTVVVALLLTVWLVHGIRRAHLMAEDAPERPMATAAFWTAAISLLAVLANLTPIFALPGCTG